MRRTTRLYSTGFSFDARELCMTADRARAKSRRPRLAARTIDRDISLDRIVGSGINASDYSPHMLDSAFVSLTYLGMSQTGRDKTWRAARYADETQPNRLSRPTHIAARRIMIDDLAFTPAQLRHLASSANTQAIYL